MNPFTPYGWRFTRNMVDLYYGAPRVWNKWNTNAGQNEIKYKMSTLPFVSDLWRYEDNMKKANDYLRNRGLTWEDVKYPTLMFGSGSGSRLVSDVGAISKLYR